MINVIGCGTGGQGSTPTSDRKEKSNPSYVMRAESKSGK